MTAHEDKYRGYGPLVRRPVKVTPDGEETETLKPPPSQDELDKNQDDTEISLVEKFDRLMGSFTRGLSAESERIKAWAAKQASKKYQPLINAALQPTQEWNVSLYQDKHAYMFENATELVELASIQEGESVLDLGCGSGELTQEIFEQGGKVIGVDLDPFMLDSASEEYPEIDFVQGDIRDLELDGDDDELGIPQTFDVVFSNASMDWIPPSDVYRALSTISERLKTGGRLVLEMAGKGNLLELVRACEEVSGLKGTKGREFWYFPSLGGFTHLLETYGMEVLSAQLYYRNVQLQDGQEGLNHWISMFGGRFLDHVNDPNEFMRVVNDKLRDKMFDGTQWTLRYRHLRVVARKM